MYFLHFHALGLVRVVVAGFVILLFYSYSFSSGMTLGLTADFLFEFWPSVVLIF